MKIDALLGIDANLPPKKPKREIHSAPPRSRPRSSRPKSSVPRETGFVFKPLMTSGRKENGVEEIEQYPVVDRDSVRPPSQPPKKASHRSQVSPLTARLVLQPAHEDRKQRAVLFAAKQRELAKQREAGALESRSVDILGPGGRSAGIVARDVNRNRPYSSVPLRSHTAPQGGANDNNLEDQPAEDTQGEISADLLYPESELQPQLSHTSLSHTNVSHKSSHKSLSGDGYLSSTQDLEGELDASEQSQMISHQISESQLSAASEAENWVPESTTEIRFKNEWQHLTHMYDETALSTTTPSEADANNKKVPSLQAQILAKRRNSKTPQNNKNVGTKQQLEAEQVVEKRIIHKEKRKINDAYMVITIRNEDKPDKLKQEGQGQGQGQGRLIVHAFGANGIPVDPLIISEDDISNVTKQSGLPSRSPDWCKHLASRITQSANGELSLDECTEALVPIYDGTFDIGMAVTGDPDLLHLVAYQQSNRNSNSNSNSTSNSNSNSDSNSNATATATATPTPGLQASSTPVFLSVSETTRSGTYQLHLTSAEVDALSKEFMTNQVDRAWCQRLLDRKQIIQLAVLEGRSRHVEARLIARSDADADADADSEAGSDLAIGGEWTQEAEAGKADLGRDTDPDTDSEEMQTAIQKHGDISLGKKWMEHYLEEARVSRGPLKEAAMASAAALVRKLQEENSSEVASNAIVDALFREEMADIAEQVYHELMVENTKWTAATVIQSKHRSRTAQASFALSLEVHKQAARKIQSACRGRLARRKYRKRYMDEYNRKAQNESNETLNIDGQLDEAAWLQHRDSQKRLAAQQAHARLKLMRQIFEELAVTLHIRPPYRIPIDAVVRLFDDSGVLIGYDPGKRLGQEIAQVLEQVWRERDETKQSEDAAIAGQTNTSGPSTNGKEGSGSGVSGERFFAEKKAPTPKIGWREMRAAIAVVMPDDQVVGDGAGDGAGAGLKQLPTESQQVSRWMVKSSQALKRACRHEREMAQVKEDEDKGRQLRELQKNVKEIWNTLSLEDARGMWGKETKRSKVRLARVRVQSMRTLAVQIDDSVGQLKGALTVWGMDNKKFFRVLHECGTYGNKSLLLATEMEFNAFVADEKRHTDAAGQGQGVFTLREEVMQELSGLEQRCALYLLDAAHNNLAGTATEVQRQLLAETLRLPKEERQALHHAIPVVLRVALAREKVALLQKLTLGFVDEDDELAIITILDSCFDSVGTPALDAEHVLEGLSQVMPPMTCTLLNQMLELTAGKEAIRMLQVLVRLSARSLSSLEWVLDAFDAWRDPVHILGGMFAADSVVPCGLQELESSEYRRAKCLTTDLFWSAYTARLLKRHNERESRVRVEVEQRLMLEAAAMDIQKVARGRKARQLMNARKECESASA